jgi:hypothetical protein
MYYELCNFLNMLILYFLKTVSWPKHVKAKKSTN